MNEIKILYLLHRHLDIHMPNTSDTLNSYGNMIGKCLLVRSRELSPGEGEWVHWQFFLYFPLRISKSTESFLKLHLKLYATENWSTFQLVANLNCEQFKLLSQCDKFIVMLEQIRLVACIPFCIMNTVNLFPNKSQKMPQSIEKYKSL